MRDKAFKLRQPCPSVARLGQGAREMQVHGLDGQRLTQKKAQSEKGPWIDGASTRKTRVQAGEQKGAPKVRLGISVSERAMESRRVSE